jgi:NADPH2:quinone reductase
MHNTLTGPALRVSAKALDADALRPEVVTLDLPLPTAGHAVVQVHAAAVNPSDVKAALGMMPHAIWPRTPGRDYAGRVVAGPEQWLGADVWGTGGDLGISRDGTHARYLHLPIEALTRKPSAISMAAAGTVGVPFITAYEGLRRAGLSGQGQTVVVFGANGKVGQAAVQLATRAGARVIGIGRGTAGHAVHHHASVTTLDGTRPDLGDALREATGARGADIAYNTVGSPYFAAALGCLAIGGAQVLISTIERNVPLDILAFYRNDLRLVGVDSLKLSAGQCAAILQHLAPGFEDGSLKAFEVDAFALLPLEQAADAYRRVLAGTLDRIVLAP